MSAPIRRAAATFALAATMAAPTAHAALCTATTTSVNFGAYDVFASTAVASTGGVTITCQRQAADPSSIVVAYVVTASTGSSNTFVARTLKSGVNALSYNLYTASNLATIWGSGSSSTGVFSGSFTLTTSNPLRNRSHTTFGRIPALQDVAVGSYTDNIVVTVNW